MSLIWSRFKKVISPASVRKRVDFLTLRTTDGKPKTSRYDPPLLLSSIKQIGYNHLIVRLSVLKDLIPKRVVLRINTRLVGLDIVSG